jgi:hypothetical protein
VFVLDLVNVGERWGGGGWQGRLQEAASYVFKGRHDDGGWEDPVRGFGNLLCRMVTDLTDSDDLTTGKKLNNSLSP